MPNARANRRDNSRYTLANPNLTQFRFDHRDLPSTWLENISVNGFQLRCEKAKPYDVGDELTVDVQVMGTPLMFGKSVVKWKSQCPDSLNMWRLGIELVDTNAVLPKFWAQPRISHQFHLLSDMRSEARRRTSWLDGHNLVSLLELLLTALGFFLIGCLLGLLT